MKGGWRKKLQRRLKTLEASTLPPELEEAFEAVENLDAMHPSSRGQAFGSIIRQATDCCGQKIK